MSSSKQLSSFCVFCLKSVQSENTFLIFKYLACLKRFISENLLEKLLSEIDKELHCKQLVKCCVDCQSLLEAFCDMYCELKHLELQLEWKLNQLIKIMKLASKVPARVSNLNRILENTFLSDRQKSEDTRKLIQNLRQHVIKKGKKKLTKSQPRVLLNRWNKNANNSFQNSQLTLSQNTSLTPKSANEMSRSNKSDITKSTFTTNQQIVYPTTQSIQQVNCTIDSIGANISTDSNAIVVKTSGSTPQVDKPDNISSDRSDLDGSGYHISENEASQQIVVTQMKNEATISLEDKLDDDPSNKLEEFQAESDPILDENVVLSNLPNENVKSISTNELYCHHCKKTFKSIAWLRVHKRKFHPVAVYFLKDKITEETFGTRVKTETISNSDKPSKSIIKGRYNFREKRTPKFSVEEIESDDSSDKKYSIDSALESSSSSSESDREIETKSTFSVKCNSKPIVRKSRTVVRKYKPRKKVSVKIESELVNGVKCFRCSICERTFTNPLSLKRHIYDHHKFKGLKITSNEKDKTITSSLSADLVQRSFKCNFCEIVMEYPSDLATHETEHAPSMETERKSSTYLKCPRCEFKYHQSQKPAYIRHHLKVHLKILSGSHSTACAMCSGGNVYVPNSITHFQRFHNVNKLSDPSKVSKCDLCSAVFITARQLYRHTYLIHDQNNHKCEICDKIFESRKQLFGHKRKHHKNWDENPNLPIGCDVEGCKKRFKTQGEFEYHKHFHQNLTPWKYIKDKCLHCGKDFRSKAQLQGHMNKTHCEHICQLCGKAFKSNAILVGHLKYHKGPDQWKFQCEECGKKCVSRNKLQEHIRTHTKEKPFVCQFCGEKYAHRHNWRNHLKTKHADEEGVDEEINKRKINIEGAKFMSRKGSKRGDCIIAGGSTKPQKIS